MAATLKDHDSIPSSTTIEDEKITKEEGELANAGDLETARSRSEEKVNLDDEPEDPYMVKWDGADDPENALNFSSRRKVLVMVMIAAIAFLTYLSPSVSELTAFRPTASAMFSPAIPDVLATFNSTDAILGSFSVSMFILGYAIGPLSASPLKYLLIDRFLAPLSELYGRTPIIHAGNVVFTIFQIGCAESNSLACLIVLRLFAGIGGSAVLSVGGGVISDTFPKEKMGGATAAFSLGPLLGPVVGPVMYFSMSSQWLIGSGGFVTQSLGWRWV